MTAAEVLTLIESVHDAENWNLGTGTTRAYRNAFFARAIGIVYWGHPIYNATADTDWRLKSTSSGAPQSDDTTANNSTGHYWDMITGVGANGYTFSASDLGVVSQFTFIPPVPNPGVVDGANFTGGDFRYKTGHFQVIGTTGNQIISAIQDQCGDIGTKAGIFYGTARFSGAGESYNISGFLGAFDATTATITHTNQAGISWGALSGNFNFPLMGYSSTAALYTNTGANRGIINSLDPDSFTVNWINKTAIIFDVNYIVFGGSGLSAQLLEIDYPSVLGEHEYTFSDIGQVTGVIMIPTLVGQAGNQNNVSNLPNIGFGTVDGDGVHQYVIGLNYSWSPFPGKLTGRRTQRTDQIIRQWNRDQSYTIGSQVELVSLGIDKFSLNLIQKPTGWPNTPKIRALVFGGPRIQVGSLISETSTGVHQTPLNFNPGALLIASSMQDLTADNQTGYSLSLGTTDGLEQTCYAFDGGNNHEAGHIKASERYTQDSIFIKMEANATGSLLKKEAAAAFDHNLFELDWLITETQVSQLFFIAFEAGVFILDPCDGTDPVVIDCTVITPVAVKDEAYSTFVTATGGVEPYTWAIGTGSLPTGLSLNASTGEISGTPTVNGVFNFFVVVTDAEDRTEQCEGTITVQDIPGSCQLLSSNGDIILSTDGDEIFASTDCTGTPVQPFSGIYKQVPGKTVDTVYADPDPTVTVNLAIPNPFWESYYFGDK